MQKEKAAEQLKCLGFQIKGLGFRVWDLEFGIYRA